MECCFEVVLRAALRLLLSLFSDCLRIVFGKYCLSVEGCLKVVLRVVLSVVLR